MMVGWWRREDGGNYAHHVSTHMQKTIPCGSDKCQFYFWFHTAFVENNRSVMM